MRVLHLLYELMPSGAEVMLHNSGRLWSSHGVEPEILGTARQEGVFAAALKNAGYPVHHLYNDKRIGFFIRYYRFLRRGNYDVVHQHVEGTGFWLSLVALLAGCRVVRVLHSNFLFNGMLRRRRALQRRILAGLGVSFVSIAEGVRRNERDRFGIESDLILNWVDTERCSPASPSQRTAARSVWGFSEHDVVVVSVGNCSSIKNHEALIRALGHEGLGLIRYLHVGAPDTGCSEEALAKDLGLGNKIIFAGWMPDALPALHAADVFAMPSLHEGFGNALAEGLSTGLPVVLTDVPGLRDFRHFFDNLIYCEPTEESIADALRTFVALDAASRSDLARHYRAIALREFSPTRGVRQYVQKYERLCKPTIARRDVA